MADIPVDIHLIVLPDLENYGEIPFDAPRTEASLQLARQTVWIGDAKGSWKAVAVPRHPKHTSVKADILLAEVETRVGEFEADYRAANPNAPLTFKLGSQVESDAYYYGDAPLEWCTHRWALLAAPADASASYQPWVLTTSVEYTNAAGEPDVKSLDVAVAISARFELTEN